MFKPASVLEAGFFVLIEQKIISIVTVIIFINTLIKVILLVS
jgi:hypothetical protein